jgi:Cysteine-rich CPXCG
MNPLEMITRTCPYCGEPVDLSIDCSVPQQEYIEDCGVCCRPMILTVHIGEQGRPEVSLRPEND